MAAFASTGCCVPWIARVRSQSAGRQPATVFDLYKLVHPVDHKYNESTQCLCVASNHEIVSL